jgi:putative aldouronate transport system permease protein
MESAKLPPVNVQKLRTPRQRYWYSVFKNWQLYAFIAPALLVVFVFSYMPLYGILMAFKDFSLRAGVMASPWADPLLQHFTFFFRGRMFGTVVYNTIFISLYQMIAGFPFPILLALMLNECKNKRFMKIVQNVTYAPNFISVVVIVGMLNLFFSPSGIANVILGQLGFDRVHFLTTASHFPHLLVWSVIWQTVGFSSIIYFAVLSGVSPELHEAAIIDGASRLRRIWHINLPHMAPTIIILFILSSANIMNVGFERVFLMQNALNLPRSEVISTYIYKVATQQRYWELGTAVGVFNNVINLAMMLMVNWIAKKFGETSLF